MTTATLPTTDILPGDIVEVLDGKFTHCRLTLLEISDHYEGRYVCKNQYGFMGKIRCKSVRFVRRVPQNGGA